MIELATTVAFTIVSIAGVLGAGALLRARTLADRIVALDLLLVILVLAIAVGAVRTRERLYLDILVVTSLLGFLGTTIVARFMERRGSA
ncbi:MAG: hypothetical protein IT196_24640 [Acidimicrobiales bacterium]|nr:hypothetical protein [Acidimicrobiales bacterium]